MTFRIALNFEDGASRFIECNPGETVLDAAFRQQINLPMDCSDGVCGTCKCHCEQGEYELGDEYIEDALSENEAQERFVLTCQMRVQSDCLVTVPVPSTACKVQAIEHCGTVIGVELVSDSTIILRLRPDNPASIDFLPGQYVNLGVPGTNQHRSYSFSSKPGAEEARFLIRNIPGGAMSGWLAREAAAGARMRFKGPNGSFFLRAVDRPVVMLAGGTGLAPILSMLEMLADQGSEQSIHLVYGVTRDVDLVEMERVVDLAKRLPTLTWATCVADRESAHPMKGYVTDHIADHHLNAGNCDIYLCGPPPMVEAVRKFLRDKGVEPRHFHYEKFSPTDTGATAIPA